MIASRLAFSNGATLVRPLESADAAFDCELFHEHRAPDFAPLRLDDAMLAALLDQQFRAQRIGYRGAFPDAAHFIIEHQGQSVGRVSVALDGEGDRRVLHLIDIVLSAAARGRGIGTDVIDGLSTAARAAGATYVTLSVVLGNVGARRLYERLGFVAAAADDGVRVMMVRHLT